MDLIAAVSSRPVMRASHDYANLYIGLTVLLLLVIALGLGVWYYRRWMFAEASDSTESWTLADLRALRETGELSEEEYEKMRQALIGGMKSAPGRDDTKSV